jgi:tRNA-dihydrouridine synthase
LPVSVKTRIGFDDIDTENWIGFLLEQKLDALIVHGRTRKEMSKVPAHWEEVAKSVQLRDNISPDTVIIGNGDVMSRLEGDTRARETGANGIMIGRGIFHDLFVFSENTNEHTQAQMLAIMADHIKLHIATWGDNKSYEPLKKFYKLYINNFAGSAKLRAQFMETKNTKEALKLIENVLSSVE